MKILHILPHGQIGGSERATVDWIRHAQHASVAIVGGEGPLAGLLEQSGCTVHTLPLWRPRSVWSRVGAAAAIVKREGIDVIHSCLYDGHLLGGLLRWKTRRPEIWFNHGPIERSAWSRFSRFIPSDALLVASASMERQQRRSGFAAKELRVHPLGVDCAHFRCDPAARTATRNRLGLRDEICVAMIARLDPLKGQTLVIEALAEIKRRRPGLAFKILFVGGPLPYAEADAYAERAKALVATLDLGRVSTFTGHVADVGAFMNAADLLVQATIVPEAFGLALIEGMAMQRVSVAPDEGGPHEIIHDRVDGFLFPPRDGAALARVLEQAMDLARTEPARFAAVGAAARRKVEEKFQIGRSTDELERLYRRLARG